MNKKQSPRVKSVRRKAAKDDGVFLMQYMVMITCANLKSAQHFAKGHSSARIVQFRMGQKPRFVGKPK